MSPDLCLLGSLLFCVLCVVLVVAKDVLEVKSTSELCDERADCGKALFLTPYIKQNLLSEARKLSKVSSFLPTEWQITSYSGYLTVNEVENTNLFFWLFPSMKNPKTAPLVLWLGGTPGTASTLSMFFRNGPYIVRQPQCQGEPTSVSPAPYHWSEIMHVLYIDSPAGAGFSYTKSSSGLANTADDVVKDLYSAVHQIFQLFPENQDTKFYIIGESYSAKYVPLLAYMISMKMNAEVKINLQGIAIGNGWMDPENLPGYAEELFSVGLIDSNTRDNFGKLENTIASLISNRSYPIAFEYLNNYFPVDSAARSSLVGNITGFSYFGNYLQVENEPDNKYVVKVAEFLDQPEIRRKLHVGGKKFNAFNTEVFDRLKLDLLTPVGPEMAAVADNYRVLMYNGLLDLTCSHHLMKKILEKMPWKGAEEYGKVRRRKWFVEGELAGYVKTVGNFSEVLVRDAGLHVAEDRPLWAWDLIKRFTQNRPFA